ncbi:MAG TPA: carboxypeptidase-like regulatory domain-containing protein [Pedobacter sp.]
MTNNFALILRFRQEFQWKYIFALVLMLTISGGTFAQQTGRIIKGKVTDESSISLPGVTVRVKGTKAGVSTDGDGNYSIRVEGSNNVLVFAMVGMATKEVPAGSAVVLNTTLMPDSKLLNDVVVIGYGTSSKKDLTGAITSVSSKEFNPGVTVNPAQLLQGKVAGLNITVSSDPNAKPSTSLRGPSTFREGAAMEPFYVIDGVPGMSIDLIAPADI